MEAKHNNLSRFLRQEDTRFYIPVYQRNYDWRKEQCEQLLRDIVQNHKENPNKEYFVGSIVYTSTSQTTKRDIIIIDGQQRITTINLMLLAVARTLERENDPLAHKIWNKFLRNEDDSDDNKLKLKHNQKDFIEYGYLISENYNKLKPGSRIYENYKYFMDQINTVEKATKVYEGFELLSFVEIGLGQSDDAQKVFQSLNSTGLDLSQADLIRNYVLMNHTQKRQEEIFNKYWSVIEDNTFDNSNLKSKTQDFFKNFFTFKFSKIPNDRDIFNEFRNRFSIYTCSEAEYNELMEELSTFSSYYFKILNPESIFEPEIRKEMVKIEKLDMTVTYPFLLAVLNEHKKGSLNSDELVKILKVIQSYIIRRFICNYATNTLRSVFSTLFSNSINTMKHFEGISLLKAIQITLVQLSRTSSLTFPTDNQVFTSLKTKDMYKSWLSDYIFEMLENNFNGFVEGEVDFEKSAIPISIEHIFPQNPSKEWESNLSKEEFNELELRRNTIGNLTIVINNASLGNKSFTYKRDLDKENSKGYKFSKFNLNRSLANLNEWNLNNLELRYEEMAGKILKIWSYPQIDHNYLLDISEDLEVSIDEVDDVSSKDIKTININGDKNNTSTFMDAYRILLRNIYKTEPELYNNPELRAKIKISNVENDLVRPIKISEEIFVYGNLSGNSIIKNMKLFREYSESIPDIKLILAEKKLQNNTEEVL